MCKNNKNANQQNGFTLVEVVISMLIFAIISLISYHALQTYSTQQTLALEHLQKINALQKASLFIKRDTNQVFNQAITLQGNVLALDTLQNDKVLKVRYLFKDNSLIREELMDADNVVTLRLIKELKNPKLRLLNAKNKWLSKYAKPDSGHIKALEFIFEHDYWGKVKQLVMIGE